VVSPLTEYLRLPVVPTVLGFDPRLQFLHQQDLIGVLRHAVATDVAGTFNVAGDGLVTLSQAIRRLQRASVALPSFALGGVGAALRSARITDLSPELLALITYGRGVDTTRMRDELGFEPAYSTDAALADFAAPLTPTGGRTEKVLARVAAELPEPPEIEEGAVRG
jgi:UDP-glucose 4-epimerase